MPGRAPLLLSLLAAAAPAAARVSWGPGGYVAADVSSAGWVRRGPGLASDVAGETAPLESEALLVKVRGLVGGEGKTPIFPMDPVSPRMRRAIENEQQQVREMVKELGVGAATSETTTTTETEREKKQDILIVVLLITIVLCGCSLCGTAAACLLFRGRRHKTSAKFVAGRKLTKDYKQQVTAALVSDLSGFTSTVKKHGILHFASLIVRKRQLCLPILHRRGAAHIDTEADNFIVAFLDVAEAAKAALEMRHAILAYNESLGKAREHFKIKLNGIGVHCGAGLQVDEEGKLLGEVVRGAYHIGEDVCADGAVLVSEAVMDSVHGDPLFARAAFELMPGEGLDSAAGGPGRCYIVAGEPGPLEDEEVPIDDASFLHPGLLPLARRHGEDADVAALDREIRDTSMKTLTVLMFSIDLGEAEGVAEEAMIGVNVHGMGLVRPVLQKFGGTGLENMLWSFPQPADAVLAAVELRRTLRVFNREFNRKRRSVRFTINGYGIHMGELLFIEGTDVHWGDPVNTASKLGQDLAEDGDVLVTPQVKQACGQDDRCLDLWYVEEFKTRSNVEFRCFSVRDPSLNEKEQE